MLSGQACIGVARAPCSSLTCEEGQGAMQTLVLIPAFKQRQTRMPMVARRQRKPDQSSSS
eukprot:6176536-Pleurochrysis_carterae.AAC.2